MHALWEVSAKEVCKMTSVQVYPKYVFRQECLVSIIYKFKSYLSEKSFIHIERIEERFPEDMEISNLSSAHWINSHIKFLELTNRNKIKSILEFYFTHWFHTNSED